MRVARRVDRKHGHLVAGIDEVQAEGFDERRLPGARRPTDPDPRRVCGRRHQLVEQRGRFFTMIWARRLDQRDRAGERTAVAGARRVGERSHGSEIVTPVG